jgi:two-component system NtrC family sensor kinase
VAGETILVVDDGRENREFIADYILRPNGYHAMTAKDGREALELAAQERPDLILLDYQMPRMNGVEMLTIMNERGLNIPVILMTFYGSEEVAVEVYRLGVRDYIKKPFSIEEMLLAVERSLSEARLRKEKDALTERLIQANRELQLRLQELNTLYSIGRSVTSVSDMEQLLPRIVDAAVKVTNAEEGYLYLLEGETLICRAHKRQHMPRAVSAQVTAADPVARHVIETRQATILTHEQLGSKSPLCVACAPLIVRDRAIGALETANLSNSAAAFSSHDSALLSALTDYAAIAIENARNGAARESS